jgi:hypothetical protein
MSASSRSSGEPTRVAVLRMQLRPDVATEAVIDGAWWPRSLDLSLELPALISILSMQLGKPVLVVFDEDAWDLLPQRLHIDDEAIRLEGSVLNMPDRVTLIGSDGQCLSLLVVPPNAATATATAALTAASSPATAGGTADAEAARAMDEVAGLLARHEGAKDPRRTAEISRWVRETAEGFADAPIQSFVPILVEHIVRVRVNATTTVG